MPTPFNVFMHVDVEPSACSSLGGNGGAPLPLAYEVVDAAPAA